MEIKSTDLVSLFQQSLANIPQDGLQEIGVVIQVGDNICVVHGLDNCILNELVLFDGGNKGIVLQLDDDSVSVFLLSNAISVAEEEVVRRTNNVFTTPVSNSLIGRVINALGQPIDGMGPIEAQEMRPIETAIPGIIERSPVNESLETGIIAIDALVPIGKGQRELIIGNRNTGKTSVVLDTILHQKDKNVICIYVSIGQRQANVARMVRLLEENGALEYTLVISADASEAVLNHYLAPYVGCHYCRIF